MFNNAPFNTQPFNIPAIIDATGYDATIIKITDKNKGLSAGISNKDNLILSIQKTSNKSIDIGSYEQLSIRIQEASSLMSSLQKTDKILVPIIETSRLDKEQISTDVLIINSIKAAGVVYSEKTSSQSLTISIDENTSSATPILGFESIEIELAEQSNIDAVLSSAEKAFIKVNTPLRLGVEIHSCHTEGVAILEVSNTTEMLVSCDTFNLSIIENSLLYIELQSKDIFSLESLEKGKINLSNLIKQYIITVNPAQYYLIKINPINKYIGRIAGQTSLEESKELEFIISVGGENT